MGSFLDVQLKSSINKTRGKYKCQLYILHLLGYGTVGKGVYKTIQTHQEKLKRIFRKDVKVVAILVKNIEKHHAPDPDVLLTDDFNKIVSLEEARCCN